MSFGSLFIFTDREGKISHDDKSINRSKCLAAYFMLYLSVAGSLFHLLPTPDIVKAFISWPAMIVIPWLFGELLLPDKIKVIDNFSRFLISWMFGLILVVFSALIFEALGIFTTIFFIIFLFFIGAAALIKSLIKRNRMQNQLIVQKSLLNRKEITVIIVWSTIISCLQLWGSSFPCHFSGDNLRYIFGALKIAEDSQIPQFGTHFPFLSFMLAIISVIFNVHPICISWVSPFFVNMAYAFGINLFIRSITKNKSASLLSAIIAVSAFYSKVVSPEYRPMTYVWLLFPYALLLIRQCFNDQKIKNYKKFNLFYVLLVPIIILTCSYFLVTGPISTLNYDPIPRTIYLTALWIITFTCLKIILDVKESFSVSLLIVAFIFIDHPVGYVASGILCAYLCLHLIKIHSDQWFYLISTLSLFIMFNYVFLSYFWRVLPENMYITTYFPIGFWEKIEIIFQSYTPVILFFSAIGLCFLIKRNRGEENVFLYLIFFGILCLYFLNASIFIRILVFLTPFIAYFATHSILYIFSIDYQNMQSQAIPNLMIKLKVHKKDLKINLKFAVLIPILLCLLMPTLTFVAHVKEVSGNSSTASFTLEEYHAAMWIKQNILNALIISDPYTQLVFGGISKSQHLGDLYMADTCQLLVKQIFNTNNATEAYVLIMKLIHQKIPTNYSEIKSNDLFKQSSISVMRALRFNLNLTNLEPLLIITNRTIEWSRQSQEVKTLDYLWKNRFPTGPSVDFQHSPILENLLTSEYFELLYKIDYKIYIFKVKK